MHPSLEEEIQELRDRLGSERDPDGRAFVPLADALRRAGSLDEAAELLDEGMDRHPDLTAAHLVAGRVFRARDEAGRAAAAYRRVIELEGEHEEALGALAEIAEAQGREAEARELYHRLALVGSEEVDARKALRRLKRRHFADVLEGSAPEEEAGAGEPEAEPELPEPEPEAELPAPAAEPGPAEPETEAAAAQSEPEPAGSDEAPAPGREGTPVYTRTMAELYARQGLKDRAVGIYEHLLEEDPDDEALQARLRELEAERGPGPSAPDREPGAGEPAGAGPAGRADEELETLARDWATGPDETGSLDSPFAWADEGAAREEPAADAGTAEGDGPTIEAYFQRLLGGFEVEHEDEPEADAGPNAGEEPDPEPGSAADESTGEAADGDDGGDDFHRWLDGLGL